jgi:hypothetical protein
MIGRPELTLIKGGQDQPLPQAPDYLERTNPDSVIEETKIFSEGEILGLIEQIAKAENINRADLEVRERTYNQNGQLVILAVGIKKEKLQVYGWGDLEFNFMIKGNYKKLGFSNESVIIRVCAHTSEPENFTHGGVVAKYRDNQWQLTPDEFAPEVIVGE